MRLYVTIVSLLFPRYMLQDCIKAIPDLIRKFSDLKEIFGDYNFINTFAMFFWLLLLIAQNGRQ